MRNKRRKFGIDFKTKVILEVLKAQDKQKKKENELKQFCQVIGQ